MTIKNIIKFKKICEFLDIDLKKGDYFNKRLKIQKAFYLLRILGINLNTKYSFYKFGPYSPDLTNIYYTTLEISDEEFKSMPQVIFNTIEIKTLEKVKKILDNWGKNLENLEFYVSLLYIYKDMYVKNRNKIKVKNIIRNLKPELFSEDGFNRAFNDLQIDGFLENF